MAKKYNLVIIGAGPAGLMTAKTASESGLKVALLERKTDISTIRRTDGATLGINEYFFGEVVKFNRKTQTLVFPVNGFSLRYNGPWNDAVFGFHIYSPGGKRFRIGDWKQLKKDPEKNSVGISLSKGKLLQGILEDAKEQGVDFFPNSNVNNIETTETGAVVTAGAQDYEGRFVVAADGINSRIVRLMGLNKDRNFMGTSRNQTWIMKGVTIPESEGMIFIITMYGMFSSLAIVEEGCFHIGTSSYDPNVDLEALLKRFTEEDPVYSPWFKNAKRLEAGESCVVNMWQAMEKPYKDHVIFVGDSCWTQEFSNVGALCAGNKLGHTLTQAFHDEKFDDKGLAPYFEWYTKYCYEPHGKTALGGSGNLYDYLTAEELDYLAELPQLPAPHTLNFFSLFITIMQTYKGLVPKISEEKPEIMGKLMNMAKNSEKAKAQQKKQGFPNR